MALYTHAQFASQCGLTNGNLTNYMKRGKVVRDKNGMYDTENPFNRDFLDRRGINVPTKQPEAVVRKRRVANVAKVKVEEKDKKVVQRFSTTTDSDETDSNSDKTYGIERTIRILDAKKRQREIELLGIKIDKLNAMVIPTDVVKLVLAQQFKNTVVAFKDGAEKFISRINKEVGLSREQAALIRGQLVSIINESVKESLSESKRNIVAIVNDYQQTRGKGERKD